MSLSVFIRWSEFTGRRVPQTNGEEECAVAAKNTARTHAGCSSVHAARHSTSDWHWCRTNDILHPLPCESWGWWEAEGGRPIVLFKGQDHMKKKLYLAWSVSIRSDGRYNERCKTLWRTRYRSTFYITALRSRWRRNFNVFVKLDGRFSSLAWPFPKRFHEKSVAVSISTEKVNGGSTCVLFRTDANWRRGKRF